MFDYQQSIAGEYEAEEIVDQKIIKGKIFYLVKWIGYPHSQNTWEPEEHLSNVPEYIAYWNQKKKKLLKLNQVKHKKNSSQEQSFTYKPVDTKQALNRNEVISQNKTKRKRSKKQTKNLKKDQLLLNNSQKSIQNRNMSQSECSFSSQVFSKSVQGVNNLNKSNTNNNKNNNNNNKNYSNSFDYDQGSAKNNDLQDDRDLSFTFSYKGKHIKKFSGKKKSKGEKSCNNQKNVILKSSGKKKSSGEKSCNNQKNVILKPNEKNDQKDLYKIYKMIDKIRNEKPKSKQKPKAKMGRPRKIGGQILHNFNHSPEVNKQNEEFTLTKSFKKTKLNEQAFQCEHKEQSQSLQLVKKRPQPQINIDHILEKFRSSISSKKSKSSSSQYQGKSKDKKKSPTPSKNSKSSSSQYQGKSSDKKKSPTPQKNKNNKNKKNLNQIISKNNSKNKNKNKKQDSNLQKNNFNNKKSSKKNQLNGKNMIKNCSNQQQSKNQKLSTPRSSKSQSHLPKVDQIQQQQSQQNSSQLQLSSSQSESIFESSQNLSFMTPEIEIKSNRNNHQNIILQDDAQFQDHYMTGSAIQRCFQKMNDKIDENLLQNIIIQISSSSSQNLDQKKRENEQQIQKTLLTTISSNSVMQIQNTQFLTCKKRIFQNVLEKNQKNVIANVSNQYQKQKKVVQNNNFQQKNLVYQNVEKQNNIKNNSIPQNQAQKETISISSTQNNHPKIQDNSSEMSSKSYNRSKLDLCLSNQLFNIQILSQNQKNTQFINTSIDSNLENKQFDEKQESKNKDSFFENDLNKNVQKQQIDNKNNMNLNKKYQQKLYKSLIVQFQVQKEKNNQSQNKKDKQNEQSIKEMTKLGQNKYKSSLRNNYHRNFSTRSSCNNSGMYEDMSPDFSSESEDYEHQKPIPNKNKNKSSDFDAGFQKYKYNKPHNFNNEQPILSQFFQGLDESISTIHFKQQKKNINQISKQYVNANGIDINFNNDNNNDQCLKLYQSMYDQKLLLIQEPNHPHYTIEKNGKQFQTHWRDLKRQHPKIPASFYSSKMIPNFMQRRNESINYFNLTKKYYRPKYNKYYRKKFRQAFGLLPKEKVSYEEVYKQGKCLFQQEKQLNNSHLSNSTIFSQNMEDEFNQSYMFQQDYSWFYENTSSEHMKMIQEQPQNQEVQSILQYLRKQSNLIEEKKLSMFNFQAKEENCKKNDNSFLNQSNLSIINEINQSRRSSNISNDFNNYDNKNNKKTQKLTDPRPRKRNTNKLANLHNSQQNITDVLLKAQQQQEQNSSNNIIQQENDQKIFKLVKQIKSIISIQEQLQVKWWQKDPKQYLKQIRKEATQEYSKELNFNKNIHLKVSSSPLKQYQKENNMNYLSPTKNNNKSQSLMEVENPQHFINQQVFSSVQYSSDYSYPIKSPTQSSKKKQLKKNQKVSSIAVAYKEKINQNSGTSNLSFKKNIQKVSQTLSSVIKQAQKNKQTDQKDYNALLLEKQKNLIKKEQEQKDQIFIQQQNQNPFRKSLSKNCNVQANRQQNLNRTPVEQKRLMKQFESQLPCKVVKTVDSCQIVFIESQFEYKGQRCFKVILDNNQRANARYQQIKANCCERLVQYYQRQMKKMKSHVYFLKKEQMSG